VPFAAGPKVSGGGQLGLLLLGFYQTGLGMLAGATGPLGAAVLLRHRQDRDWLVVNTAVYMSLNHLLRFIAFAALGFSLAPWQEGQGCSFMNSDSSSRTMAEAVSW